MDGRPCHLAAGRVSSLTLQRRGEVTVDGVVGEGRGLTVRRPHVAAPAGAPTEMRCWPTYLWCHPPSYPWTRDSLYRRHFDGRAGSLRDEKWGHARHPVGQRRRASLSPSVGAGLDGGPLGFASRKGPPRPEPTWRFSVKLTHRPRDDNAQGASPRGGRLPSSERGCDRQGRLCRRRHRRHACPTPLVSLPATSHQR